MAREEFGPPLHLNAISIAGNAALTEMAGGIHVAHQKSFGGTRSDSRCHLHISGFSARKICHPTLQIRNRRAENRSRDRRR